MVGGPFWFPVMPDGGWRSSWFAGYDGHIGEIAVLFVEI
jgi:hypothetical protein